jgi:glycosyltransferase involved in cell wall biosynthesis
MQSEPTVSVVIATYKRAGLVPRAIDSVLRQTFQDFEIIVVDDGSPDNTKEVVASVADKRIRYIRHEKNKGLPAGRNTGIRAAMGRYIAFLDDDDRWREDKLAKQVKAMQTYDAVVCAAEASGKLMTFHRKPVVELADLRRGNQFPPSGLMAKASLLKEVLFDEQQRQGEDWDALIRIAQRCSIGYIAEPLLLYNDGEHDRMTNKAYNLSVEDLEKRMAVLYKHKVFFGSFWFNHHAAMGYLLYFRHRNDKLKHVTYTIRLCGLIPVISAFVAKVRRRISIATAPIVR